MNNEKNAVFDKEYMEKNLIQAIQGLIELGYSKDHIRIMVTSAMEDDNE